MNFREFAKNVRFHCAQLGVTAHMSRLNDALAVACYDKTYSAVIAAEKAGSLPVLPDIPPYIGKAARKYGINSNMLGQALTVGKRSESLASESDLGELVDWLHDKYTKQFQLMADKEFYGLVNINLLADVLSDQAIHRASYVIFAEWMIAEGEFVHKNKSRKVIELLSADGFWEALTDRQIAYLNALSMADLGLYMVKSVTPGYSMQLVEMGRDNAIEVTVLEKNASKDDLQGKLLIARVLSIGDHNELSGASQTIDIRMMEYLVKRLISADTQVERSRIIREAWLEQYDPERMRPKQFILADSGDELVFINDYYLCSDFDELANRLDNNERFEGGAGNGWSLLYEGIDGKTRQMCLVKVESKQRISVFYESAARADKYKPIFEKIANNIVSFSHRITEDPIELAKTFDAREHKKSQPKISGDMITMLLEQAVHELYANWADNIIPMLDNMSPRQMLNQPNGEARVREVLALYVGNEMKMAAADRREPVSYDFLYDSLGIAH